MTQVGALALLLKKTAKLCIKNKSEDTFINPNTYCFCNILDTLRILTSIHIEGNIPPLYKHELHCDCFKKIAYYLILEDSRYFILLGRDIDSTMLSKYQIFQIESWLAEDGVYGGLELLYWGSRDVWKESDFIPSVTTRVKPLQ